MNAKEYFDRAWQLDVRINNKIKQVEKLKELALNCTSALTGMPSNPSKEQSRMANTIDKIIDMQAEINAEIDKLVDFKDELNAVIRHIPDIAQQTVLEMRYLRMEPWEQIAAELDCSLETVFRIHRNALKSVKVKK